VRNGFKELKEFGYLELEKVWNDARGKFEGTVYQLCLNYQSNFPKTPKTLKTPKTAVETLHCNVSTDDVSFENLENKKRFSNVETLHCNVSTDFLPFLENDEVWKKQFVGKDICKEVGTTEILTLPMLDLLLKHFTQTSISSGTTYPNVAAIKRHFFNWFNANLNKNALSNYIEQQAVAPKKVRKQVADLMPKTDAILNKIYGQQCENETHLYRCLQLLETHLAAYENALNFLDAANKKAVETWIADIENAKNLFERGRKAGQLNWFCKRNSKRQLGNQSKSNGSINSAITNLSQRFAAQH
jgi:hypothetical protein